MGPSCPVASSSCPCPADLSDHTAFRLWEALAGSGGTQLPLNAWVFTTVVQGKWAGFIFIWGQFPGHH